MGKEKRIISKEEYFTRMDQGVPVGNCWVDMGNGEFAYALHEVVVTSVPTSRYNDRTAVLCDVFICMADNTRMNTQSMDIKRRQMELSMEYERKMKDVKERLSQALCLYYSNEKMRLFGTEGGKEKVYEMELKESWLLYAIKNDVTPLTHDAFPRDFRIQNSPLIVEYFQLKDLPEENSDTDNWLPNAIMAARMFFEWEFGIGPVERNFDNDRIANAFRNAWKVNEAREFFYEKYAGVSDLRGASVTNYKGKFNLKGLFKAGIDPIEQFVGSYDINIYVIDGTHLQFVLKNTTSMKSLLYGIGLRNVAQLERY